MLEWLLKWKWWLLLAVISLGVGLYFAFRKSDSPSPGTWVITPSGCDQPCGLGKENYQVSCPGGGCPDPVPEPPDKNCFIKPCSGSPAAFPKIYWASERYFDTESKPAYDYGGKHYTDCTAVLELAKDGTIITLYISGNVNGVSETICSLENWQVYDDNRFYPKAGILDSLDSWNFVQNHITNFETTTRDEYYLFDLTLDTIRFSLH